MKRRSLLGALGGVAVGWFGATLLGGRGGSSGGADSTDDVDDAGSELPAEATTTAEAADGVTETAVETETTVGESPTAEPTPPPTPTPERTTTPSGTPTATPEPTPTETPAARRTKVDLDVRGHSSDPETSYTVLHTVTNDHEFPVRVTFWVGISLRDGSNLRETLTVELGPGGVANDSTTFTDYEPTATGWKGGLVSVERS
ncbi:hypothetical protein ACFO0N_00660 [Halobium salinum]|uniref:Uncharacterized protein n=1 Tax=Halobium salinum TaxID=1364940 RepID=A0ABD5P6T8_9EURY|nr:hypothetical protein [Halobium salinum]